MRFHLPSPIQTKRTPRAAITCPECRAPLTDLADGRRLSDAPLPPYHVFRDTVLIPLPFPLEDAPPTPINFPAPSTCEAAALFGTCSACQVPVLLPTLSLASAPCPVIQGHFTHDDRLLATAPSAYRPCPTPPSLFVAHASTPALPRTWIVLRDHYAPTDGGPQTLTVDQHFLASTPIRPADLPLLHSKLGMTIRPGSLPLWLPLIETLHAAGPLAPLLIAQHDTATGFLPLAA